MWKQKGDNFIKKSFRTDWQSKRICWVRFLGRCTVPEREGDSTCQQVTAKHWRSTLTRIFHLATWLPICHFTCHRLNLHPFSSVKLQQWEQLLGIIWKKCFFGLPPLCGMPHSAGNQFLCISKPGEEGEIKKGKLKRKQGGKRGKEVRSGRS